MGGVFSAHPQSGGSRRAGDTRAVARSASLRASAHAVGTLVLDSGCESTPAHRRRLRARTAPRSTRIGPGHPGRDDPAARPERLRRPGGAVAAWSGPAVAVREADLQVRATRRRAWRDDAERATPRHDDPPGRL